MLHNYGPLDCKAYMRWRISAPLSSHWKWEVVCFLPKSKMLQRLPSRRITLMRGGEHQEWCWTVYYSPSLLLHKIVVGWPRELHLDGMNSFDRKSSPPFVWFDFLKIIHILVPWHRTRAIMSVKLDYVCYCVLQSTIPMVSLHEIKIFLYISTQESVSLLSASGPKPLLWHIVRPWWLEFPLWLTLAIALTPVMIARTHIFLPSVSPFTESSETLLLTLEHK